jgi:uncharacterized membrane protein YcjF (UPF0283 family)
MSEHKSVTEFLRQCIRYDQSTRRRELEATITQIQRDQRCVNRAVWLMGVLMLLAAVVLGYAVLFVDNFPHETSRHFFHVITALGVGSLISLLVFSCLGMTYRRKLDLQREECRRLIARLLETRLGNPAFSTLSETPRRQEDRAAVLDRAGTDG